MTHFEERTFKFNNLFNLLPVVSYYIYKYIRSDEF